ncbi:MAG: flagellar biosynthesis protein FlhB [Defluviitaleaceae bacterium]|nr:flagellar biosynthesis protein FlhB [Defluviitaleaceae bacterium]
MRIADEKDYNLIPMSLTFFNEPASEKTEKATPKKRDKAREEGQVAQSQEISTAILFIAGFLALRAFVPSMWVRLESLIVMNFERGSYAMEFMENNAIANFLHTMFLEIFFIFLPIAVVIMLLNVIAGLLQVGWKPTAKTMKPNFKKLSPLKGIKKIFGSKILMELFKTTLKFTIVLLVVLWVVVGEIDLLLSLYELPWISAVGEVARVFTNVGITVGLFYLVIAAADYAYNRAKHEKEIRMTKQEVKDEYKQTDGDPLIKGKIRQKMREASMRRMMQDVPGADVVITNPTHFACAIRYDPMALKAPVLVAKGADNLAARIRDVATEHDVTIVEDKPLARTLYSVVEVGDEVPAELWQAVAEILAYVYSVKGVASPVPV